MRGKMRLDSAHALAIVALFVALGAGAYAAGLARNSVKSKHIKDGQVHTADLGDASVTTAKIAGAAIDSVRLADGAVGSAKLADGSVGAAKIADGAVGSAKLADGSVDSAKIADGSVSASDVSPGLGLSCPAATTYVQGVCIESNARVANNFAVAEGDCEDEGKRLPDQGELYSYALEPGVTFGGAEWTVEWRAGIVGTVRDVAGTGTQPESLGDAGSIPYRCAVIP